MTVTPDIVLKKRISKKYWGRFTVGWGRFTVGNLRKLTLFSCTLSFSVLLGTSSCSYPTSSVVHGSVSVDFVLEVCMWACMHVCMQEEFSEDMVRIIQTALNDEDQLPTRRKHNNSVRSIFIKVCRLSQLYDYFSFMFLTHCYNDLRCC